MSQILITFVATTFNGGAYGNKKERRIGADSNPMLRLDVHKAEIVATVEGEGIKRETRTFTSTTRSLTELKEWLLSLGVTHVAMVSTGVYWKPVFNILGCGGLTILVVNARHIKYVPGHKTGKKGSAWICKLLRAIRKSIESLESQIKDIDEEINRYMQPVEEGVSLLCEIPGIKRTSAIDILAEIGVDMPGAQSA